MLCRSGERSEVRPRGLWACLVLGCVLSVGSGCSMKSDGPVVTHSTGAVIPSKDPEGEATFTFTGHGQEKSESAELAGDYAVSWEVTNNRESGAAAGLIIYLCGDDINKVESLATRLHEPFADGGDEMKLDDLEGGKYYLNVSAGEEADWAVTFERI